MTSMDTSSTSTKLRNGRSNGIDFNAAPLGPFAVFLFFLAGGAGEDQAFAVAGEAGVSDAEFGVQAVFKGSGFGVEEGGVPFALEETAGHYEVVVRGVPAKGFHEAGAAFAV